MKTLPFLALTAAIAMPAMPALAEEPRQLDAHEHGVGQLNIAIDGRQIAMEFQAPGADIVGFEYAAESAEDRAAVDAAVATLARPLDLFVMTAAASCSVVQASAALESEDGHGGHKDHAHDDHDEAEHDDHAHEDHDEDHAHDDHAEDKHGDDDHAEAGHAHDDHDEDTAGAGHTEFHAEYTLDCADPSALSQITFAYFETFPNALEVEVQLISDAGATSFEVTRDAPTLDLRNMF